LFDSSSQNGSITFITTTIAFTARTKHQQEEGEDNVSHKSAALLLLPSAGGGELL
jgi:hypothetical protein